MEVGEPEGYVVTMQMRNAQSSSLDPIPVARNGGAGIRRSHTLGKALPSLQEPLLPELHLVSCLQADDLCIASPVLHNVPGMDYAPSVGNGMLNHCEQGSHTVVPSRATFLRTLF